MEMRPQPEHVDAVELLASSGSLTVYRYPHGCVHVQFGTVTLRVTLDEFSQLVHGLGAAFVRMTLRDVVELFVPHPPIAR